MNPHKYVNEYDLSIWADGSMVINTNLDEFVDTYMSPGSIMGVSMHPYRNCIFQELVACQKLNKESPDIISIVNKKLINENYPHHIGLIQSGIIIRFHNDPECISFDNMWWEQIKAYSHRDQLSFNYVIWKQPIPYNLFSGDIMGAGFLICHHNSVPNTPNNYIKLKPDYGQNFYLTYGKRIKTKFIKKP